MGNRRRSNKPKPVLEKMSPEELARLQRAEEQIKELDEQLDKQAIPIKITSRPLEQGDTPTSLDALKSAYPDDFLVSVELHGNTHKFICKRFSHFEIFPNPDEDDDTQFRRYEDSVTLITKVVQEPKITREDLAVLPVSLVTQLGFGIQKEIMPRYRDVEIMEVTESEAQEAGEMLLEELDAESNAV